MKPRRFFRSLAVLALFPAAAGALDLNDTNLDPAKTIETEGSITLTDGSSYYTFSKGGDFISGPIGFSGRELQGQWKLSASAPPEEFTVTAKYGWVNGASADNEYRKIVFHIYPGQMRPFRDHMVPAMQEFAAYFLIEEFVKIPKPEFAQP